MKTDKSADKWLGLYETIGQFQLLSRNAPEPRKINKSLKQLAKAKKDNTIDEEGIAQLLLFSCSLYIENELDRILNKTLKKASRHMAQLYHG